MAVAPDTKPFERKHVIHTNKATQGESKLAQHSLSPEKLGVVGYVKDVAGFVRDVVDERRHRRRSTSTSSVEEHNSNMIEERQEEKPRRRSSAEEQHHQHQQEQHQQQQQQSTGFADAVTGLFPGVNTIGNVNASGCTHADELRSQMMHINNEHQHDHNNKLL
ncbi:hypothetical protein BD770DRAFT_408739 [Pilaira anomala]|nr:hypothetical protein BD770DRAFT_408739 [Pilaira anomala]